MGKAVNGVMCSQGVRETREARDSCVQRGVDYFRSMGVSAPDGARKPRDVAEDRCSRTWRRSAPPPPG